VHLLGWETSFCTFEALMVLEVAETRRILAAAGRQHGLVTTGQLVAYGWSHDVIAGRMRGGWLTRVYQGVYLVGPLETPHTAAMAAVLATDGIVSSYPAAVLWDWRPDHSGSGRDGRGARPGAERGDAAAAREHAFPQ
jgi:Transcriptional regulator, AbiEi antitoxin